MEKQWARWRLPALLAGFWLLLFVGNQSLEYRTLSQQQQQLQQQMTTLYRQLFPAENGLSTPRAAETTSGRTAEKPQSDSFQPTGLVSPAATANFWFRTSAIAI